MSISGESSFTLPPDASNRDFLEALENAGREAMVNGIRASLNSITFTLPLCPPSVNSLYSINYKAANPADRVSLKPECRRWKSDAKVYIPRMKVAIDSILQVDRTYYYPFLTKTGQWKKSHGIWDWTKQQEIINQGLLADFIKQELIRFAERDSFNMDKLLFDAISEKLGIDARGSDKRFKDGTMRSFNSKTEKTIVTLTEIPCSEWSKRV